jgi:hypothetical protein
MTKPTKEQIEMYKTIKEQFKTQEELIKATYVRTGMLPMSTFEKGKKAGDIEVGYAAFDIQRSSNPPDFYSGLKHSEMKELAQLYTPNDKLLEIIDNVKLPVIESKPVKAKTGNGCSYKKPASC